MSISIHAPHTGRDILNLLSWYLTAHFNPRAPYGARPSGAALSSPLFC